ncbi:MAG: hypothetical protein J3R72DRAFT_101212 [Linnemannia gamsii]|nr:MAG: hypothetical protein J3R72DRAFT_101212 [Linnemannia gamsii]
MLFLMSRRIRGSRAMSSSTNQLWRDQGPRRGRFHRRKEEQRPGHAEERYCSCGVAWSSRYCYCSRIKAHAKRGVSKLTQQHRKHGPVGHTNENRTSRVRSCCFVPMSLSRASRTKDGDTKTVRLNGAVECKNPVCPRRRAGRGSMGWDTNAASNIAISGASILLSANHTTLPAYRPFSLPTMTASATILDINTTTQGHPMIDAPRDCLFR